MCFQYADDYDFDYELKEDLWFFINRMDRDFMSWWVKKQPKPPKVPRQQEGGNGKPKRSR